MKSACKKKKEREKYPDCPYQKVQKKFSFLWQNQTYLSRLFFFLIFYIRLQSRCPDAELQLTSITYKSKQLVSLNQMVCNCSEKNRMWTPHKTAWECDVGIHY